MSLPLHKRYLSDSVAKRLYASHKELRSDPDEFCPTCLKKGFYFWPDKETKVECDCSAQLQLHKHYLNAGIGALYQRLSFADFNEADEDMLVLADKYLSNSELMVARGIGIILTGSVGTGKTFLSTLLLKNLLHEGYSVFSTTFAGMVEMFTAGWYDAAEKEFYHERVKKSEILLIDDIGKEFRSKNALSESTFDSVLRSRVQDGRPTFITTNMTLEDMKTGYGAAIFSLLQETSIVLEVIGQDYRERAGNSKLQEILAGLTRPII